jgi:hypothetical protein
MKFNQKLDFLMNVTKTSNSMLARYISLDASHVSRLRTGSRYPAKNADYIRAMAAYFARHCTEEQQTEMIMSAVSKTDVRISGANKPEDIIISWLSAGEPDGARPIGVFLDNLSRFSFRKMPAPDSPQELVRVAPPGGASEIFYGTEGKRTAVIMFLNDVLRQETPRTLLLFSEENFDWLTEKRDFTLQWAALLQQVIMKGNRIRIIHNVSRHLDEMLAGIAEWLPIYMTGMVEPYYYPKTRDGIFQRTVFAAPGVAVILSTSVTGRTSKTANYLVHDKTAVEAAVGEFNDYLQLCRPLLHVFRAGNTGELRQTLEDFAAEPADTIIKTDTLSIMTMPQDVAFEAAQNLADDERLTMLENHRVRIRQFHTLIEKQKFHEIIRVPDIEELRQGKLKVIASDFLLRNDMFYTPETYKRHLENMIRLLRQHENYNVYIDGSVRTDDIIIYVREAIGILVAKNTLPSVLFAINESRLTTAFWDYLKGFIGKEYGSQSNRKRTIERLETILKDI